MDYNEDKRTELDPADLEKTIGGQKEEGGRHDLTATHCDFCKNKLNPAKTYNWHGFIICETCWNKMSNNN